MNSFYLGSTEQYHGSRIDDQGVFHGAIYTAAYANDTSGQTVIGNFRLQTETSETRDFPGYLTGVNSEVQFFSTGTGTHLKGLTSSAIAWGFPRHGDVNNLYGMEINVQNIKGYTSDAYGINIKEFSVTGTNNSDTLNAHAINIGSWEKAINPYTIYSVGDSPAYFEGSMGLGTNSPGEKLEVVGNINSTGGDICITGGNCLSTVSGGGEYASTAAGWTNSSTETNTSLNVNIGGSATINDVLSLTPQSSAPAGNFGDLYVDDSNALCFHNNTDWVLIGGTGTCS